MKDLRHELPFKRHSVKLGIHQALAELRDCQLQLDLSLSSSTGAIALELGESVNQTSKLHELASLGTEHRNCRLKEDLDRTSMVGCENAFHDEKVLAEDCHLGKKICDEEKRIVVEREASCKKLKLSYHQQRARCDKGQELLEDHACEAETASKSCDRYLACHAKQDKKFQAVKARAVLRTAQLDAEEAAAKEVECILRVKPGSDTSLDDCNHGRAATDDQHKLSSRSGDEMRFPEVSKRACMSSAEGKKLLVAFYSSLPAGAPAKACKSRCCAEDGTRSLAPMPSLMEEDSEKSKEHLQGPSAYLAGVPIFSQHLPGSKPKTVSPPLSGEAATQALQSTQESLLKTVSESEMKPEKTERTTDPSEAAAQKFKVVSDPAKDAAETASNAQSESIAAAEPTSKAGAEPVSDAAPESASKAAAEPVSKAGAEPLSEAAPESASKAAAEPT
eukprot:CAMPEP_0197640286 /NCGR_PEP_ID=MMETSP1338-20131121/14629_1 /TAXON_ID=43686 ORGANISM="Pelagodinium beii, Strain RCC1491" /NCGR_SAMPLE_ID=MMETSP1338 /ASSEMBLY_ACC=CAM_ASM_000754 /LENGTH=447 /DNA_ID=CAMNT_0043213119 /DNA_START=60 /DNA_END=1400 /DNA_ORIENTATION=+